VWGGRRCTVERCQGFILALSLQPSAFSLESRRPRAPRGPETRSSDGRLGSSLSALGQPGRCEGRSTMDSRSPRLPTPSLHTGHRRLRRLQGLAPPTKRPPARSLVGISVVEQGASGVRRGPCNACRTLLGRRDRRAPAWRTPFDGGDPRGTNSSGPSRVVEVPGGDAAECFGPIAFTGCGAGRGCTAERVSD
jgi:hypothetical protein